MEKDVERVGEKREIEKFIIRQPPKGEKDDYDSENSLKNSGRHSDISKRYAPDSLFFARRRLAAGER